MATDLSYLLGRMFGITPRSYPAPWHAPAPWDQSPESPMSYSSCSITTFEEPKKMEEEQNVESIQLTMPGMAPDRVKVKLDPNGRKLIVYLDGRSYRTYNLQKIATPDSITPSMEHGLLDIKIKYPSVSKEELREIEIPLGNKQFLQE